MNKKDLKPGTVYGYVPRYRSVLQPVLFLSADLHTVTAKYREDGTRDYVIAQSHPRSNLDRNNGYLVLHMTHSYHVPETKWTPVEEQLQLLREYADRVPEIMASLGDLARTDGKFMVGTKLDIGIVPSRNITGVWEDVSAVRNAADAKSAEFDERGASWAEGRNVRLSRVRRGLESFTGESVGMGQASYVPSAAHSGLDGTYRSNGSITLSLEQVERIIAVLAAGPITE